VFDVISSAGLLLVDMVILQIGAAFAKHLFHHVDPAGVAALRIGFAAAILLVVWRPSPRMSRRTLAVVGGYGVTLATMNISFYQAMDRIPLGAAVTIEFIGPLAVALAGSRRALDVLWTLLAALGVLLLSRVHGGLAMSGVVYALLAAASWAGYILLGVKLGSRTSGGHGLALGMAVGSVVAIPLGVVESGAALARPTVLLACLGVALLSSVIPYSLELEALRRMPARPFGVLMSLEPAIAAMAGRVVLGEALAPVQWLAVACVGIASIGATRHDRSQHDDASLGRSAARQPRRIRIDHGCGGSAGLPDPRSRE
jgi:inner membrane transporter RhtA